MSYATVAEWYHEYGITGDVATSQMDRLAGTYPQGFLHPAHWYRLGIPRDAAHTALWARLTPVRVVSDLPFGMVSSLQYPGARGEDMRRHRIQGWMTASREAPLIVVARLGRYDHARLLVGYEYEGDDLLSCRAVLQDPARPNGNRFIVDQTMLSLMVNTRSALRHHSG